MLHLETLQALASLSQAGFDFFQEPLALFISLSEGSKLILLDEIFAKTGNDSSP